MVENILCVYVIHIRYIRVRTRKYIHTFVCVCVWGGWGVCRVCVSCTRESASTCCARSSLTLIAGAMPKPGGRSVFKIAPFDLGRDERVRRYRLATRRDWRIDRQLDNVCDACVCATSEEVSGLCAPSAVDSVVGPLTAKSRNALDPREARIRGLSSPSFR